MLILIFAVSTILQTFLFTDDDDDDDNEDMLWLYNHTGPFLQLNDKWSATLEQRKRLQRQLSINDFVKKFPCLKQQHGWEMVSTWFSCNIQSSFFN